MKFIFPAFIALLVSGATFAQTVITNVTIVDVENQKLIPAQNVVITGSIISDIQADNKKIPAGATVIDGHGKYLMPGMTDAHVHFFQDGGLYARPDAIDLRKFVPFEKQIADTKERMEDFLRRYLQAGITTVIDPGSTFNFLQLRDSFANKNFAPSVYMAGPLITTYEPDEFKSLKNDEPFILVKNMDDAKKAVQMQLPWHPDFIKIWYITDLSGRHVEDSARSFLPLIKVTIEEAHKYNLKVAVHATERITAQLAAEAGCDYLVHGIEDEIITDDFISLLKNKNIILCPTLNVEDGYYKTFAQFTGFSNYEISHSNPFSLGSLYDLQHLDAGISDNYKRIAAKANFAVDDSIRMVNLKKMSDAGVMIASGTDAGNIGTQHASSYLLELNTMKKCGMSNWEIIRASTLTGAKILGNEKNYGSIAAGKVADMILFNANPLDSLFNLTKINLVFKNGKAISPDTLIHQTPEMIVQQQLNAYNTGNLNAFLHCYASDVELYNFPDSLICKGIPAMKKMYSGMFSSVQKAHCEIKNRTVLGNTVIDKESITGIGKKAFEGIVIYKTENNKIRKVYFMK